MGKEAANLYLGVRADTSTARKALENIFAVSTGEAKKHARVATVIAKEQIKQDEAREKSAIRVEKTRAKAAEETASRLKRTSQTVVKDEERAAAQRKQLVLNQARFEYLTKQKSAQEYAQFLNQQLRDEKTFSNKKIALLREQQRVVAGVAPKDPRLTRGDIFRGVAGGTFVGNAASAGVGAVEQALREGATAAINFDANMRNVNSIVQLSETEFQKLTASVLRIADDPDIRKGPNDLAIALYEVVGSSFKGDQALGVLEASAKGAGAGLTETKIAADGLISILNSGIKGADRNSPMAAMNVLLKTVEIGKGSFAELSQSLPPVIGTAAQMGVTFQEVAAFLAVASLQGQSFSDASNDLLNVITKIVRPSKEAQGEFRRLGISFGARGLEAKGLTGVLDEVIKKTNGNKDALAKLFPDMQAFRGVLSGAAKEGKSFAAAQKELAKANEGVGATAKANAEQQKALKNQLEKLKSEFETMVVRVGPAFITFLSDALREGRPLLDFLADLARAFSDMPEDVQATWVKVAGVAAIATPTVLAIGQIATAVFKLRREYELLRAASIISAATGVGAGTTAGAAGAAAGAAATGAAKARTGAMLIRVLMAMGAPVTAGALTALAAYVYGGGLEADQLNAKTAGDEATVPRSVQISNAIPYLRDRQAELLKNRPRNYRPQGREGSVSDDLQRGALGLAGLSGNASADDIEDAIGRLQVERQKAIKAERAAFKSKRPGAPPPPPPPAGGGGGVVQPPAEVDQAAIDRAARMAAAAKADLAAAEEVIRRTAKENTASEFQTRLGMMQTSGSVTNIATDRAGLEDISNRILAAQKREAEARFAKDKAAQPGDSPERVQAREKKAQAELDAALSDAYRDRNARTKQVDDAQIAVKQRAFQYTEAQRDLQMRRLRDDTEFAMEHLRNEANELDAERDSIEASDMTKDRRKKIDRLALLSQTLHQNKLDQLRQEAMRDTAERVEEMDKQARLDKAKDSSPENIARVDAKLKADRAEVEKRAIANYNSSANVESKRQATEQAGFALARVEVHWTREATREMEEAFKNGAANLLMSIGKGGDAQREAGKEFLGDMAGSAQKRVSEEIVGGAARLFERELKPAFADITKDLFGAGKGLQTSTKGLMQAGLQLYALSGALTGSNGKKPDFLDYGIAIASLFPAAAPFAAGAKLGREILGFAEGGAPPLSRASWFGEDGPEMWVPREPGNVLNQRQVKAVVQAVGAGGGRRGGGDLIIQGDIVNQADVDMVGALLAEKNRRESYYE